MLVLALALTGCGGGDSGPSVDVSGKWRATANNGDVSLLTLHQDANGIVTGTADDGTVTGSVDGDHLSLQAQIDPSWGISETVEATVSGNTMSGTYEVRGDGINANGTFTATKL
jgi:hypothetical protein